MQTQEKNTTDKATKKRSKLNYVPYDIDFFSKEAPQAIMRHCGSDSMIIYMQIVQKIGGKDSGRIRADSVEDIAYFFHFDVGIVPKLLELCLEKGFLYTDGTYLYNSRIDEAQELLADTREDNAERKAAEREAKKPTSKAETPNPVTNLSQNGNCDVKVCPNPALTSFLPSFVSLVSSEGVQGEPPPDKPDAPDDFEAIAKEKLEVAADQSWVNSATHQNTGRRPLKQYPELWFTEKELADTLRDYDGAAIPPKKWGKAFKLAQSKAQQTGKNQGLVNAYAWMIGFVKQEIMKDVTQENYMHKSEKSKHGTAAR